MVKRKRKTMNTRDINHIVMMSAWSFTIVVSSFLFLYVGRWIDVKFETEPTFMIGLFILGIGLCIGRMYNDFTRTKDNLEKHHSQA